MYAYVTYETLAGNVIRVEEEGTPLSARVLYNVPSFEVSPLDKQNTKKTSLRGCNGEQTPSTSIYKSAQLGDSGETSEERMVRDTSSRDTLFTRSITLPNHLHSCADFNQSEVAVNKRTAPSKHLIVHRMSTGCVTIPDMTSKQQKGELWV